MNDLEQHAADMAAALQQRGPHMFRHGKVVMEISGFYVDGSTFWVEQAQAWYDDVPVFLDLPLGFHNAIHAGDPLAMAYWCLADLVRTLVAQP